MRLLRLVDEPAVAPGSLLSHRATALLTRRAGQAFGVAVQPNLQSRAALLSLRPPTARAPALIDCFGRPLHEPHGDGDAAAVAVEAAEARPLLRAPPSQAALQPIHLGLTTGTTAVDALTPIGRGQSMVLLGAEGTGKSSLILDAILAQATTSVECVLGLSHGGLAAAAEISNELVARGLPAERLTVVATRGSSAVERALVEAAACAVGEGVRDRGGHALVALDELLGHLEVWDAAACALSTDERAVNAEAGSMAEAAAAAAIVHPADQRVFYGALLQRASQLTAEHGGGSLTLLAAVEQFRKPQSVATGAALALADFEGRPAAERARLEALSTKGIALTHEVLQKIGIRPPVAADAAAPAVRSLVRSRHVDQLISIADGHLQLHADLAAQGWRPALRPSESLVRVGAGSDADVRSRPMPAAMMRVAPSLRLELAQAADLPPSGSDPFIERQRVRMRALAAVLRCQPERAPRRLSHEIAILVAVLDGRLDSLCDAAPAAAALKVEQLIEYLRRECHGVLDAIDQTGEMDDAVEATLSAAIANHLPGEARRSTFASWEADRPSPTIEDIMERVRKATPSS